MSCTVIIKDKNLKPENIKKGVTILKVKGTLEGGSAEPVLQDVSLSYAENGTYTISASEGYDGLGTVDLSVNVNTQPNLQNASVAYVSNGNYTVSASSGYDGLGTVDVSVNIDGVTNWIVEAKMGRLTDISGCSIAELVAHPGGAAGLFMYSNITTLPNIKDPVDNPENHVSSNSLSRTFQGCLHLQSVDMSVGGQDYEGMKYCFSESGVRDASIDVSVLYNNVSDSFNACFSNCLELRNLYIHLGPQARKTGYNTFSDMCYNAGNAWNNNDNTTITIEGLTQVSNGAFNNAFGGMHSSNSGGITVNLPDNLSTISGTTIWNAFSNMFASSKFTDPTTPSFLGKLNYIVGNGNFSSAFSNTNIESATLGFNELIGDNNFEYVFNYCGNLKSVTFDGSFGITGNYNFNYTFEGCDNLTSMTCTSTAGTLPFRSQSGNNVAESAPYVTDVTIDNVNSDVFLPWQPNLSRASVYGILSKAAGATIQQGDNRIIMFYDGGLTVEDYPDGRIQDAYDAAVNDGWTIDYLTINQATSEILVTSPANGSLIYTDSSTITFIAGTSWTATADSGLTLSVNSGNAGDASINITAASGLVGSKTVTISSSNETATINVLFPDDPNNYDFVDYIESTGQTITLGNPMRFNDAVYAEYEFKASDADGGIFIGTDAQDSKKFGFGRDESDNLVEYFGTSGVQSWYYSGATLNNKFEGVMGIYTDNVGGWTYTNGDGGYGTYANYSLDDFAGTGTTPIRFADANNYGKLWSLKVYENLAWGTNIDFSGYDIVITANQLYNYVPAKRKSDDAYGLYETVTNQFYTAAGITGGMDQI